MSLASTRHVQRNPSQGSLLAAPTKEGWIRGTTKRYAQLSEFKQDLLAADQPIRCIHRAIELIGRRPERATSIAHALMGEGPVDDDLADLIVDLTPEQKRIFSDVLLTFRRRRTPEEAPKTLAKLKALSEWMTLRAKDLTSASTASISTASSENSSAHWEFAKTKCSTIGVLLDAMTPEERLKLPDTFLECLDGPNRLVFMKKMSISDALQLNVKHRYELLQALASTHRENPAAHVGGLTKSVRSYATAIQALTDSILSSEECFESGSAVLSEVWRLARCDRHVDGEISRFLLRRMQEDFVENSPRGTAVSASSYEHYPLMFAVSHLSTVHADHAIEHLSQAPCTSSQARLMVGALAGSLQLDLIHRFLKVDGYSREALKPLLMQPSVQWLKEFTASFVELNSPPKTRVLQAAATALGSPRVSQIVRNGLGNHWVEPAAKRPTTRGESQRRDNFGASAVSGVAAWILVVGRRFF